MSAVARQQLWAKAEALRPPRLPARPPEGGAATSRALALAERLAPRAAVLQPVSVEDLAAAPAWAAWPAERRARLARLAGGVATARALGRSIQGDVLGRAAQALGPKTLDAVLALPADTPAVSDRGAERGEADALERLGAAVLLAEVGRPALRARLTALFEDVAPAVPDEPARAAGRIARRLWAELDEAGA